MSGIWTSLKPFAPLLFTFFLPRLINVYRTVRAAHKTRPPRRPLPPDAARATNLLFLGACLFFLQTLPLGSLLWSGPLKGSSQHENIFTITNSRLKIPTDILFARLSLLRRDGMLTAGDEVLKSKLQSLASRVLYLRYGPQTIISCSFCSADDPDTYLLHYLPLSVVLPHLISLLSIGVATSQPLSGSIVSAWRTRLTILSILLAGIDIYTTISWIPNPHPNMPSPSGPFWTLGLLRSLSITVFLSIAAFLIYASATNRFVLLMHSITPPPDPETYQRRSAQQISQLTVALQMANTKLNAYSITRNAVVRDEQLKGIDDEYWRAVVAMEGLRGIAEGGGIWDDEEVQAAIARTLGGQGLDVEKMNREARNFVGTVTKDLDRPA